MPIQLFVEPKMPPMEWEAFCREKPRFAVAIDGYVKGGPRRDPNGPRRNFNHHEDVPRFETRATCAQVLLAVRTGFFDRFQEDGIPRALVYANDCDQDVCTSWFVLRHHYYAKEPDHPRLDRLVHMEDMLDTTSGAYPYPKDLPVLGELAWVFEPYTAFRLSGALDARDVAEYRRVIDAVEHRIIEHLSRKGGTIPLDTRYEVLCHGAGWTMVRELGAQARTGMFADGIHAFVSVRERPDGRYVYAVGRMSPDVPFELSDLYRAFNVAEGITGGDAWGGSDTCGGSPRVAGSGLFPKEVAGFIDACLVCP